jgi:hypothetical protein
MAQDVTHQSPLLYQRLHARTKEPLEEEAQGQLQQLGGSEYIKDILVRIEVVKT